MDSSTDWLLTPPVTPPGVLDYYIMMVEAYGEDPPAPETDTGPWPYGLVERLNLRLRGERRAWRRPDEEFLAGCRKIDHENGLPWIGLEFKPRASLRPGDRELECWREQHRESWTATCSMLTALVVEPESRQHSRRLTLRLPLSTHVQLQDVAAEAGLSINTLILLFVERGLMRDR